MSTVLFTLLTLSPTILANTTLPLVPAEACGFQGDDNTYGLGLRLGLYAQWLTTSLANNFVPDEAITMRGVNNCFQLSTFAGLLYITLSRPQSQLYAVEAFLVLILCIGGVASGRGKGNSTDDPSGADVDKPAGTFSGYRASTIGGIIQLLLVAALTFYGIWFVYVGMDRMQHPACSRVVFFFAKVDLYHWFRVLLKIAFTASGIGVGFLLVFTGWAVAHMVQVNGFGKAAGLIFGFSEEAPATQREGEGTITTLRDITVGYELVWLVLSVELLIQWNHIEGVGKLGSTGQLLPLVVGGSGLIRVLYKALFKWIRGDYRKAESFSLTFLCCSKSRTVTRTGNSYSSSTGTELGIFNSRRENRVTIT